MDMPKKRRSNTYDIERVPSRETETEILRKLKDEGIVPECKRPGGMSFYIPLKFNEKLISRRPPRFLKRLEHATKPGYNSEGKDIMSDKQRQEKYEEKENKTSQTTIKRTRAKASRQKEYEETRRCVVKKHQLVEECRNEDKINKDETNTRLENNTKRRKGNDEDNKSWEEKAMKEHEERSRYIDDKTRSKNGKTLQKIEEIHNRMKYLAKSRREEMDERIRNVSEQQERKF